VDSKLKTQYESVLALLSKGEQATDIVPEQIKALFNKEAEMLENTTEEIKRVKPEEVNALLPIVQELIDTHARLRSKLLQTRSGLKARKDELARASLELRKLKKATQTEVPPKFLDRSS